MANEQVLYKSKIQLILWRVSAAALAYIVKNVRGIPTGTLKM
jgi:hypothetical protein